MSPFNARLPCILHVMHTTVLQGLCVCDQTEPWAKSIAALQNVAVYIASAVYAAYFNTVCVLFRTRVVWQMTLKFVSREHYQACYTDRVFFLSTLLVSAGANLLRNCHCFGGNKTRKKIVLFLYLPLCEWSVSSGFKAISSGFMFLFNVARCSEPFVADIILRPQLNGLLPAGSCSISPSHTNSGQSSISNVN